MNRITTVPVIIILSLSELRSAPAPVPELQSAQLREDRTSIFEFEAIEGRYYVLWRSSDLESIGVPINLLVPAGPGASVIEEPEGTMPDIPLQRAFYRLSGPRVDSPLDLDNDNIDDLYEFERSAQVDPNNPYPLHPFDGSDAFTDPDGDGDTHYDDYITPRLLSPNSEKAGSGPVTGPANPIPGGDVDLSKLLGISIANDAASDYTPSMDSNGNIGNLGELALADSTRSGFQYPGTYYLGVGNQGERRGFDSTGRIAYAFDSSLRASQASHYRGDEEVDTISLNYKLPDRTTFRSVDFSTTDGIEIIANPAAHASIASSGGVDDSPYLVLTDAENDAQASVILPDLTGADLVRTFYLELDIRMGGGSDLPGEGMSVSFVRPDDPLLQWPPGVGYAGSPDGNQAEEGSRTGLSICLDSRDSTGGDTVGITALCDGNYLAGSSRPLLNGALDDPTSLQTGPLDHAAPLEALGWARLQISIGRDQSDRGTLKVWWKGVKVIDQRLDWVPSKGRFVIGARTSEHHQFHHVDNVTLNWQATSFHAFENEGNQSFRRAHWKDLFYEAPPSSGNFYTDADGKLVHLFPNIVYSPLPDPSLVTREGYSVEPLDLEGLTFLAASPDQNNDLVHGAVEIGFCCDPIQIDADWGTGFLPTFRDHFGNILASPEPYARDHCQRVFVARYADTESGSRVVEFPLVDGSPSSLASTAETQPSLALTLIPKDDGAPSIARVRTSTADPRRDLRNPELGSPTSVSIPAAIVDLLSPGDAIIPIDEDEGPNSSYPSNETPAMAIDGDTGTKYLNFGRENSGFIVTPLSGPSIARSFQITTANDWVSRDPASFQLFGTNDPISSADNTGGDGEDWALVASGNLELPDTRFAAGDFVNIENSISYASYRVVFPTMKGRANLMQLSEFQMFSEHDAAGQLIVAPGDPIIAIHLGGSQSYSPESEQAFHAIDGDINTKYLNAGATNSGFIVTPEVGISIVTSFTITTANDAEGRDPVDWALYGINQPVATKEHGTGNEQSWIPIAEGSLALPADRRAPGTPLSFSNTTGFRSYKFLVRSLKNPGELTMQFAEIQFHGKAENIDANLRANNLLALQDLDGSNSNNFGIFTVPESGITVLDASLLADELTYDGPNLVGVSDGGQTGTFELNTLGSSQILTTGFGATIDRDGTFPWLRDSADERVGSVDPGFPTGLYAPSTGGQISVSGAKLEAHSFEFALPGIRLADTGLRSTGAPPSDPLNLDASPYYTDPSGTPLGYVRFNHPEGTAEIENSTIEAATDLDIRARDTQIVGGDYRALGGMITATSGSITVDGVEALHGRSMVWLQGKHDEAPSFLHIADTPVSSQLGTGSEIRCDNFSTIRIGRSLLSSDIVRIRALGIYQANPLPPSNPLAAAIEAAQFPLESSGSPPEATWIVDDATTHDGRSSARAGEIDDSQWVSMSLTVEGPGVASFWWKVSSEEGWDWCSLLVDGRLVAEASGEVDWEEKVVPISGDGPHVLTWTYEKDSVFSDGQDTAWVDEFSFVSSAPPVMAQSVLADVAIDATQLARIYTNHELVFRNQVSIENGQLAARTVTVEPGATLELTGADAGVFTNVHNYGFGGFGDLLINGVPQDGSTQLPNFHLRPYFDEE